MRRIRELYWRLDRVEHIYEKHNVTVGEVEEAVFGDTRGRLFRIGPAKRDPGETVYDYFGRTEAGRYLMVVLIYLG